jgi:hypothetical protein
VTSDDDDVHDASDYTERTLTDESFAVPIGRWATVPVTPGGKGKGGSPLPSIPLMPHGGLAASPGPCPMPSEAGRQSIGPNGQPSGEDRRELVGVDRTVAESGNLLSTK